MEKPLIVSGCNYTEKPDLSRFRMHTHEDYEIYCFLSGDAQYFVEGTVYNLKPGDILIMKKAEAHSLLIHTPVPYGRVIVNFEVEALLGEDREEMRAFLDARELGKDNRYAASLFKDRHWQYYLGRICEAGDMGEKRLYLTILVHELYENRDKIGREELPRDTSKDIIAYINEHLTDDLDLESICSRFYLSKSQLNRKFKRVTGSTVWEYISAKRLLLAKEFLQKGEAPTHVAERCGFHDYCTFFRAYKRRFGISPKEDHRREK